MAATTTMKRRATRAMTKTCENIGQLVAFWCFCLSSYQFCLLVHNLAWYMQASRGIAELTCPFTFIELAREIEREREREREK